MSKQRERLRSKRAASRAARTPALPSARFLRAEERDAASVTAPCSSAHRKGAFAFIAALLCIVALMSVLAFPAPSYAEDPDDNKVDQQQLPDSSFLYDTSLAELATADPYFDGQTVKVTGEAVGDKLHAGAFSGHTWILLEDLDGAGSPLSVYVTEAQAASIDTLGEYGTVGSIVQVQGTFNLACSEHTGLTDLHADTLMVTKPGYEDKPPFSVQAFIPGIALCLVGGLLSLAFMRLRERRR